jgi:hypothetical protein
MQMSGSPTLRQLLQQQPIGLIAYFAGLLGWTAVKLEYIRIPKQGPHKQATLVDRLLFYYITPDENFNLQINTYPPNQTICHRATIKAERYGIQNVGWHEFRLGDNDLVKCEAARLAPWLRRSNFTNTEWRNQLRKSHPEFFL